MRLRTQLANEPGANLFLIPVPVQDIRAGGRQATASYQFTLLADDLDELRDWEPQVHWQHCPNSRTLILTKRIKALKWR